MPDKDVEAVISEPAKPPVKETEEVDVGVDVTGDRVPDLWLKLRGRTQIIALLVIAFCAGALVEKYLL